MITFNIKTTVIAGAICSALPVAAMADSAPLAQAKLGNERIENNIDVGVARQKDNDSDYISTFSGTLKLTDDIRVSTKMDSEGFLEVSAGHGFNLGKSYIEPYIGYGKTDHSDVKTAGVFASMKLNPSILVFADTSYEWRDANSDLGLGIQEELLDQQEWKTAVGASITLKEKLTLGYTLHHDRITDSGLQSYDIDDNRNSHEVSLAFNATDKITPYVQYTYGPHRVSTGSMIVDEYSVEAGVNFRF